MKRILLILALLCPTIVMAQTYPAYESVYINDYGSLIEDEAEAALAAKLEKLRDDTGIEMTVLTLRSWKTFGGHDTVESFATGLFNDWGIGDANQNDGILILVAQNDRDMRIELGNGYSESFDIVAGDIIDQHFIPAFRDANYSEGIVRGTTETIIRIAERHAEGLAPEERQRSGAGLPRFLLPIMFAGVALLIIFRRFIGDLFTRFKSCPNCGRRGLHRHREVVTHATTEKTGLRTETTNCSHCDYNDHRNVTIPIRTRSSSSSGGSFGGGSSSGGGASGKW